MIDTLTKTTLLNDYGVVYISRGHKSAERKSSVLVLSDEDGVGQASFSHFGVDAATETNCSRAKISNSGSESFARSVHGKTHHL